MRIVVKAFALFVVANVIFVVANPLPMLGRISGYNTLWAGRLRLPYADAPDKAYSLTLDSLDAMFASHEISRSKPGDEYRVVLIGDSSTWGWLLHNDDTLAGQLNARDLKSEDGRNMRFYNLGYPIMSLAKDVLILNRALGYQPDMVIWLTTLESFPPDKQLTHPLLLANIDEVRGLGLKESPTEFITPCAYGLSSLFCQSPLWSRNILARRRDLADMLRLQLYGPLWEATGIDQEYPRDYERAARDYEADDSFHGLRPPTLASGDLAFGQLDKGIQLTQAKRVQIIIVNEPILISTGRNSDLRYNFFYPRWAYDQYRAKLTAHVQALGVHFVDAWDLVPADEFTNSAVHESPIGVHRFSEKILQNLK